MHVRKGILLHATELIDTHLVALLVILPAAVVIQEVVIQLEAEAKL